MMGRLFPHLSRRVAAFNLALLLSGTSAFASEPAPGQVEGQVEASATPDTESESPEHGTRPAPDQDQPRHPRKPWLTTWSRTPERWFFAVRADVGYPFIRSRLSLGYGQPHDHWVGVDITPVIGGSDGGAYGGLRWDTPYVDLRSGLLYLYSFRRSFLPAQERYDRRDIDTLHGENASYFTWDSELKLRLPLGRVKFVSDTQLVYLRNVEEDNFVYLASLAAVVGPRWSVRQEFSAVIPFDPIPFFYLGPALEVVWNEARPEEQIWRAGAHLRWELYSDIELRMEIMPVVSSPDQLGFVAHQVGEVKLRWRWATK